MQFNTGTYKVTIQPATEPISLEEAKLHLKVDTDADDTLITALITSARQYVERYCNIALITQTVTEKYDCLSAMRLSVSPVVVVTSVQYLASPSGDLQTLSTSLYGVDTYLKPAQIYGKYGATWPAALTQRQCVTVVYVAGYGDEASDVPAPIISAMLLTIGDLYENRQDRARTLTSAAEFLLNPYRITYF